VIILVLLIYYLFEFNRQSTLCLLQRWYGLGLRVSIIIETIRCIGAGRVSQYKV